MAEDMASSTEGRRVVDVLKCVQCDGKTTLKMICLADPGYFNTDCLSQRNNEDQNQTRSFLLVIS